MEAMNSAFLTDGYKTGHHIMYPTGTTYVYSNFTPRANKYAPKGCDMLLNIGQQMLMKKIHNHFQANFFGAPKDQVCQEMAYEMEIYLGGKYDVTHFEQLYDAQCLPIEVKALEEGTLVPMRVPTLTVANTCPLPGVVFHWITNYLETIFSTEGWVAPTSATLALHYRRIMQEACLASNPEAIDFVKFQGHDFSMRGMGSVDAAINSGIGHASVFFGSDTLPVIPAARKYYGAEGMVIVSVNATEHSVMCAGGMEDEVETFRELMRKFPTGILSIVSDTWDLTKVLHPTKGILVQLKDEIMARDGKIVIRPDSGCPVKIVCGHSNPLSERELEAFYPEFYNKGVVQCLYEIFGCTESSTSYDVLDEHIGCIYGDSITPERCQAICDGLMAKGFASTNTIFGIGSYTYQCKTRDTFGFAMKATYVELSTQIEGGMDDPLPFQTATIKRPIFKDPMTDDGTKKSAKGLLAVTRDMDGEYMLHNDVDEETEAHCNLLATIYRDGVFFNQTTLMEIRERVDGLV
jgi:nicotinamide phosphoribosyltransferase